MRPERLYLVDIVDAADAIERSMAGMDRAKKDSNETYAQWREAQLAAAAGPAGTSHD
jgi:hypothetical protein